MDALARLFRVLRDLADDLAPVVVGDGGLAVGLHPPVPMYRTGDHAVASMAWFREGRRRGRLEVVHVELSLPRAAPRRLDEAVLARAAASRAARALARALVVRPLVVGQALGLGRPALERDERRRSLSGTFGRGRRGFGGAFFLFCCGNRRALVDGLLASAPPAGRCLMDSMKASFRLMRSSRSISYWDLGRRGCSTACADDEVCLRAVAWARAFACALAPFAQALCAVAEASDAAALCR